MNHLVVAGKVKAINDLLPPKGNEGITLYMYAEIPDALIEQMEQAESEPVAWVVDRDNCKVWWSDKFTHISQAPENNTPLYATPQPVAPCPTCESVRARLHVLIDRAEYKELQAKCAEYAKTEGDINDALGIIDSCCVVPLVEGLKAQLKQHRAVLAECEKAMRLYFNCGITGLFYYEVREAFASIKALKGEK